MGANDLSVDAPKNPNKQTNKSRYGSPDARNLIVMVRTMDAGKRGEGYLLPSCPAKFLIVL